MRQSRQRIGLPSLLPPTYGCDRLVEINVVRLISFLIAAILASSLASLVHLTGAGHDDGGDAGRAFIAIEIVRTPYDSAFW